MMSGAFVLPALLGCVRSENFASVETVGEWVQCAV